MCLTLPRNPGLRIPLPLCQEWIRCPFRSLPALTLGDCRFLLLASLSPVAQTVKRLPAMQETQVRFLGREDPLEKEMATHSSILAWEITWTEEPGGLQSLGSQRVRHNLVSKVKESAVAQSCLTLCDPMDCSLPDFSVHEIFQARVLEWVAISFSRGSA